MASGGCGEESGEYDPTNTAYHHIGDANVYSIGPWSFPLPCILYAPDHGLDFFSSGKFGIGHHGTGHYAYKGYVLYEGTVRRVNDVQFPNEKTEVECVFAKKEDGQEVIYVKYNGQDIRCDNKSTADGGLFGGGLTSFYDFSITKNVVAMFLVFMFLGLMFIKIARMYSNRVGKEPKGIQSFIEPIFLFIQDEVAKPFLGKHWERFLPYLMSIFFFILGLNLFGQIPFFGGANVTGNFAFTMVLAIIAFIIITINGNKDYWEHVFWMPGVPAWVKIILTPVEVLGIFIKPFTLMLRLFANITAGHIVVLSFIGLIFIFGKTGTSMAGATTGVVASLPLTLFMMAIELLVAFIQAFVFTILTASYLGAATEEHH
jgi:F-type H+-transporting ATPase subunit a